MQLEEEDNKIWEPKASTRDVRMSDDSDGSEPPRRKLNSELVQMAHQLAEIGPNINEIARRTDQYKETVRYRYHRFFLDKGIKVQAVQSYSKLGFKRLVLIAKLALACEANARAIFNALSDFCYLRGYTRVLLSGEYVIHVAVPSELAERCAAIYTALQEAGLFSELEILEFEEIRNPPMKPESFDFAKGTWSFDWESARTKNMKLPLSGRPKIEKYDKIDLLIMKELDIDASRRLVKMAANLKTNLNAVEFHYREHVKARGLIKGYRLVWQGTHYDVEREKTGSRKDIYIELTILLEEGTRGEVVELMLLLNKTPFLWSEAYGSAYCAEVFLPNYAYTEFLEYIDEFANKVGEKLRVFVMDQGQALSFVISHSLFDAQTKQWSLNPTTVTRALSNLAPLVGGGIGSRDE